MVLHLSHMGIIFFHFPRFFFKSPATNGRLPRFRGHERKNKERIDPFFNPGFGSAPAGKRGQKEWRDYELDYSGPDPQIPGDLSGTTPDKATEAAKGTPCAV